VTFTAAAGTVYHIAVDGEQRLLEFVDVGTVVLEWKMATGNEPVAVDDYIVVVNTTVDPVGSVNVLANDFDPNGGTLTLTANTAGVNRGDIVCTSAGVCTYTTRPGFDDRRFTDIFKYTVTVSVNLPVAADDAYATPVNAPLTVAAPGVLGNDGTDVLGDPFTAGSAGDPPNGSVVLNPDGSFTYTPEAGFVGIDTFTYHAFDVQGRPSVLPATVTVTVIAP